MQKEDTPIHLRRIQEIKDLHTSGQQEISETVGSCISAIEANNKKINAVVWSDRHFIDNEISRISNLHERPGRDLPLLGIPVLVKEIDSAIEGTTNSWGNKQLKQLGTRDNFTATSVTCLRNSGAVIVGKTNNPELALTVTTKSKAHGPCSNPLDATRNSGGSSGGAAASVAAGMASVATGSDGGGSIRIPAAACGVFGFKPSRNVISLGPILEEFWGGLVCKGLIASNLGDLREVLNAMKSKSQSVQPGHLNFKNLKIGIRDRGFASMYDLDPSVISATNKVATYLSDLGHDISISSPSTYDDISIVEPFLDIIAFNTFSDVVEMKKRAQASFDVYDCEPETIYFHDKGSSLTADQYKQACGFIEPFTQTTNQWFENFDILITPTIGNVAPLHGEVEANPETGPFKYSGLCFPSNITGAPSLSIPVNSEHKTRLPVGVQIVAREGNDALVLELGSLLESDYSDIFVTGSRNITT